MILFFLLIICQILLQQLPVDKRWIWRFIDYHDNTANEITKNKS